MNGRSQLALKIISLAAIAFIGGALGMWANDRTMPVTVLTMEAAVSEVSPGGVFRARYQFIRHRSCDTHVERLLFDGTGQRFVIPDLDFAAGILPVGHDAVFVPALVPPQALPSAEPATYRTLNCYACNPVHMIWPICDNPRDIKFWIVAVTRLAPE